MGSARWWLTLVVFFFQAEDGIRDVAVTGVQTCALPISLRATATAPAVEIEVIDAAGGLPLDQIGRASCRERVEISGGAVSLKKKKQNIDTQEASAVALTVRHCCERLRSVR